MLFIYFKGNKILKQKPDFLFSWSVTLTLTDKLELEKLMKNYKIIRRSHPGLDLVNNVKKPKNLVSLPLYAASFLDATMNTVFIIF